MKFRRSILALALLGAAIGFGLAGPSPARAQIDITMGGSSASDLLNDKAIEALCGGVFTRFTRTGSSGNGCPSSTASSIRAYTCNVRFCVGGTRAGLACSGIGDTCPGGACGSNIAATFRLSGFGSEFGVLPINGNCTDLNNLCNANQLMVLDPTNCNLGGTGGNNNCACIAPGTAVTTEDLGVSDVKGGSFIPPVPQPANSAAPVAVPFKFILSNDLETGICNGGTNNARNCSSGADCPSGTCVQTKLSRLAVAEAQSIWAAGVPSWNRVCWNPDTYTCNGGTNANQACNPNNPVATECPKTLPADPQPQCVNCTAFGPSKPMRICPRTATSGTRACQVQVVHANNGLPFVGGAGPNVDVFYPADVGGTTAVRPACPDTTTQATTFPFSSTPGADGLCDDCPDLDGDDLCDIVVREGTATGDVDNCVDALDGSIGFIAADRFDSANWYGVGYDKTLHSLEAMRNGSSSLWCSLTYNKRPNNTYDTNSLNGVNSVIDRVNTPAFLSLQAPAFSTDSLMRVLKNGDRGPIIFKP